MGMWGLSLDVDAAVISNFSSCGWLCVNTDILLLHACFIQVSFVTQKPYKPYKQRIIFFRFVEEPCEYLLACSREIREGATQMAVYPV